VGQAWEGPCVRGHRHRSITKAGKRDHLESPSSSDTGAFEAGERERFVGTVVATFVKAADRAVGRVVRHESAAGPACKTGPRDHI